MSADGSREQGSASVWVVAAAALIILVAFATVLESSAILARHRAENAADLAALAGAQQIGVGPDPCGWAERIAAANGVSLASCVVDLGVDGRSGTVSVAVSRGVSLPILGWRTARAASKAAREPAS